MREVIGVYQDTITVFNFHADSNLWYPSVVDGTDLIEHDGTASTHHGKESTDNAEIIIHCGADRSVITSSGVKAYVSPKKYGSCEHPESKITFKPECDFIYAGAWPDLEPIDDDEYENGLYHAMNDEHDGIYMIQSVTHFKLLPHFEIGGK